MHLSIIILLFNVYFILYYYTLLYNDYSQHFSFKFNILRSELYIYKLSTVSLRKNTKVNNTFQNTTLPA